MSGIGGLVSRVVMTAGAAAALLACTVTEAEPEPLVRSIGFDEFEVLGDPLKNEGPMPDGKRLSLMLHACNPKNVEVDLVESDEAVEITLTQTYFPPTTNERGEVDVVDDCQSAYTVPISDLLGDRIVIDGSTALEVARN